MKKLAKLCMVAGSVALLAACVGKPMEKTEKTFGGYSVQDLQQRYNTVYFGFDKYNIEGEYVKILDAHAALLKAMPATKVSVEGHADERGTPEYNIALGQRRADMVKAYLATKDVKAEQVSTVSYGEERPAVSGHSEAVYMKNRRAVLAY